MIVGLALAGGCAVATNIAFLVKHRGAVAAPPVEARHALRSAAGLFRTRAWTVGFLVAVGAWGLHVAALALAPLAVVQAVIAGGLVFLGVLAERYFGFHLRARQWLGVGLAGVGLGLVAIAGPRPDAGSDYSVAALIAFEGGVLTIGALLVVGTMTVERLRGREGAVLGIAAGALFGVSDVAIKHLAGPVTESALGLISPWTAAAVVASVIAFYSSARGLQIGPGIEVITLTSVAANLAAIAGGILVFGDRIGSGALASAIGMVALLLVICGAALMPGPVRARSATRPTRLRPRPQLAESPA
jgi:drug/metabolite transporter (DMT)-like permease